MPTRKQATLELLLTDMHTLFHPPTTLPPLKVDSDKLGKDGDHDIVVFAPMCNNEYKKERTKKTLKTRPLPDSQIFNFEKALIDFPWLEAFKNKSVDEKVETFHNHLRTTLDLIFPEKTTKMSNLDREWMSPEIKQLLK